jgi:lambda repressor-like predicted transcriptional regulator
LKTELGEFLRKECRKRGLSLRRLSLNSGLSPGTVHNILQRKYQPTLSSLNCIADYLGLDRAFLWGLAGLIQNGHRPAEVLLDDPRVRLHLARLDKLPDETKDKIFDICDVMLSLIEGKS